jgi:RNA recognition motif-containing protein
MSQQSSKVFLRFSKLDRSTTKEQYVALVQQVFQKLAQIEVEEANITLVEDRDFGGYRNFCFVLLNDADEAGSAIDAIDGVEHENAELSLSIAKPKENRSGGGFGGGKGGYNNRGY